MYSELYNEVMRRLPLDFDFQKQNGDFLQQGICPDCGKREFYTHKRNPWVLRCGRLNKCGTELHIKDCYPDLFESWSDRFPSKTNQQTGCIVNPNAAADAYMQHGRGFNLTKIKSWYQQGSYYCGQKQIGTATVKFTLPCGTIWERFIDKPERFGAMKANFIGKYQGLWWQAPNFCINTVYLNKTLWLTEGIFDAIALLQIGVQAVSVMSCNNFPVSALAELERQLAGQPKPTLIFAFDTGKAGESFTRKFVQRAKELGWDATAAQPPSCKNKLDWNRLLQLENLSPKLLDECRYLGQLLIATTARDKATLMFQKTAKHEFPFEFNKSLYWFKLNPEKYDKASQSSDLVSGEQIQQAAIQEAMSIQRLCKCYPQALYYQENSVTDDSWYYFRVDFPHDNGSVKKTFTGAQLSSSADFKRRLLSVAPGAIFRGQTHQLDAWLEDSVYNVKRVKVIDYVGYVAEHKCYIFSNIAVSDGVIYQLNDEDFFDVKHLSIKSFEPIKVTLNPELAQFNDEWVDCIWKAFGTKGFVALAFWFGSYFAEQLREAFKCYPFLELVGEPGTGKSSLVEFMWKLSGRYNQEGFDPCKANKVAVSRNMAQVSNLPVVFIEADRGDASNQIQSGFHWDALKDAYNGRGIRSRGVKNNRNDTYEPPFKGTVVISQNADVVASPAILERLIHVHTDRSGHSADTRAAVNRLNHWPMEQLSGFLVKAAVNEKTVMEKVAERTPLFEQKFLDEPNIGKPRIALNHGLCCALVEALALIVDISQEQISQTQELLRTMAIQREYASGADHPLVQEFWDVYEFLEGDDEKIVNHSRDNQLIAISLNQFAEEASARKQRLPPLTDLKALLKSGKAHKYQGRKPVNSAVNDRLNKLHPSMKKPSTVKCWVFDKGA